jgi:hypothetical protein
VRRPIEEPVGITAANLVVGDRQKSYGDPLTNYERFAKFLEAILDLPSGSVTRRQAMHVMIGLKQCRDLTTAQRDNEVDICGYAHLLQMEREAAVPVGEYSVWIEQKENSLREFKDSGADLT